MFLASPITFPNLGIEIDPSPVRNKIFDITGAFETKFAELDDEREMNLDKVESGDEVESGIIKQVATENAIAAVEAALKLAGNHGISRLNPLERHLRDVLCGRIHSPQEDTVLVAAGRAALGL